MLLPVRISRGLPNRASLSTSRRLYQSCQWRAAVARPATQKSVLPALTRLSLVPSCNSTMGRMILSSLNAKSQRTIQGATRRMEDSATPIHALRSLTFNTKRLCTLQHLNLILPPSLLLTPPLLSYSVLFANLTARCLKDPHWSEPPHMDLIVKKHIIGFDKLDCPQQEGLSQLVIILLICGGAAIVFITIFTLAIVVGRQKDKRGGRRDSKFVSRDLASVIEGTQSGGESSDEVESLLTSSSSYSPSAPVI